MMYHEGLYLHIKCISVSLSLNHPYHTPIRCITDSRERERVSACLVLIEQLIIDLSTGGPPYLSPIYSIDCNLSPAKYHHISPFLMQPVDVK